MAHGTECVEHHLHSVLWCISVTIEAIETAGEIAGSDTDELARTRVVLAKKYDRDMLEAKLFQHALGSFHPMKFLSQSYLAMLNKSELKHIEPLSCGWGKEDEIRRHIVDFKKSGKFVVGYMPVDGEKEYYLACACGELYAPPSAYVALYGLTIQQTFLGGR